MGSWGSKPIPPPSHTPSNPILAPKVVLHANKILQTQAEKDNQLKHHEIIFYSKKKEYHIHEQLR
jgi:hypothetical protein